MTVDIHLFFVLPLLSVFVGFALHLWRNSNSLFPPSSRHPLYVLNLGLLANVEPIVLPILRIIRTVRRKLLRTGDNDDAAPSFVLF